MEQLIKNSDISVEHQMSAGRMERLNEAVRRQNRIVSKARRQDRRAAGLPRGAIRTPAGHFQLVNFQGRSEQGKVSWSTARAKSSKNRDSKPKGSVFSL